MNNTFKLSLLAFILASIDVYSTVPKPTNAEFIQRITYAITNSSIQNLLGKHFKYSRHLKVINKDKYLAQLSEEIYMGCTKRKIPFEPLLIEWRGIIRASDLPEYYDTFLFSYLWRKILNDNTSLSIFEEIVEAYAHQGINNYNIFFSHGWFLEIDLQDINGVKPEKRGRLALKRRPLYQRETQMRKILVNHIIDWPQLLREDHLMRFRYHKIRFRYHSYHK